MRWGNCRMGTAEKVAQPLLAVWFARLTHDGVTVNLENHTAKSGCATYWAVT